MADIDYCAACEELREQDPNLIANGFTDENCTNLTEDKGLTGESTDCEDLNMLNDCLIESMEDEAEISDVCDWREYMKKFVPNVWTVFKGLICAVCGLWTAVRSYRLTKVGNDIILTAFDGEHGRVTDDTGATYSLSKSGSTITLNGSDGSTSSVQDSNTTYGLTKTGNTIKLTGSDGSTDSVTDKDTTYDVSISGHTISLNGSDGSTDTVTVPDDNTTYSLSKSGDDIVMTGSDGSRNAVTDANTTYTLTQVPGSHDIVMDGSDGSSYTVQDTRYRLHTSTYTKSNVQIAPEDTVEVTLTCNKPSSVPTDLAPMAVAGWTLENGTNVKKVTCRYIQLINRQTNQCQVRAVFYNAATSNTAEFDFMPEVLWWGLRTTSE